MAIKDVLLQLSSYPEPTPVAAIEQAVGLAEVLGAHISALTFKIEIPSTSNVLANALLDIPGMIAAERQKSVANAQDLISVFESMATQRGVAHDQIVGSCPTSQLAAIVTEHARMHDVTMIPIGEQALQQYVAESVIFGSGRPTIVFPEVPKVAIPFPRHRRSGLGFQPAGGTGGGGCPPDPAARQDHTGRYDHTGEDDQYETLRR